MKIAAEAKPTIIAGAHGKNRNESAKIGTIEPKHRILIKMFFILLAFIIDELNQNASTIQN